MEIKRDLYLKRLISYMWDGQVKVITGIRRYEKSYLLRTIFRNCLLAQGEWKKAAFYRLSSFLKKVGEILG